MSTDCRDEDVEVCELLLVIRHTQKVVVIRHAAMIDLPCVTVLRHARPAEQITIAVRELWSLNSIVIEWESPRPGRPNRAILEVLGSEVSGIPDGFSLASIYELEDQELLSASAKTLSVMLRGDPEESSPFGHFGWIAEAQSWIRRCLPGESLEFTTVRQLNAGGAFALLRLSTLTGKAFWLKAVGGPNTSEFETTSFLAERCSKFLPPIVGMRKEWNAWIMEEFGRSLHASDSLADFECAVATLAALQQKFVGNSEELLARGFTDHRLPCLKRQIDEIVIYLDDAMRHQTSGKVERLSAQRLSEIGAVLHDACDFLQEQGIPDTLMHGDISPGSILGNETDCVFTDWCEAYVGNPFITFELLCVHAAKKTATPELWKEQLVSCYASCWNDLLSEQQITAALKLIPLIAVLSYLYGNGEWLNSPRSKGAAFQGYARSLARQMHRLAAEPSLRTLL